MLLVKFNRLRFCNSKINEEHRSFEFFKLEPKFTWIDKTNIVGKINETHTAKL